MSTRTSGVVESHDALRMSTTKAPSLPEPVSCATGLPSSDPSTVSDPVTNVDIKSAVFLVPCLDSSLVDRYIEGGGEGGRGAGGGGYKTS